MELYTVLEKLKLNAYEREAYIVLLRIGSMKALEISKLAKIPQGRIYDTLRSLEQSDLVTVLRTEPKVFQAVDPKIALASLLRKKKEEAEEILSLLPNIELPSKIQKPEASSQFFELLIGKPAHMELVSRLKNTARREILQFAYHYTGTSVSQQAAVKLLRKKDVDYKLIIYSVSKENRDRLERELAGGADIRISKLAKHLSFAVRDREEAEIAISDPRVVDRIVLLVKSKPFAEALARIFIDTWKRSKPLTLKDLEQ